MLEFDRTEHPIRQAILTQPVEHDGGIVRVPDGPGLGIDVTGRPWPGSQRGELRSVMRGLDPRIHPSSQESFEEEGLPGQALPYAHISDRRCCGAFDSPNR